MKIISGRYPEERNWQKYINFLSGPEINLTTLYRIAAYNRDIAKRKCDVFGYRGMKDQQRLYEKYKAGKGPIAALPGKSRHNYGLAVDYNRLSTDKNGVGIYPGTLNADYNLWLKGSKERLNDYGLRHAVKGEIWHIEPIETAGVSIDDIAWFPDVNDLVNTLSGYPRLELTEPYTRGTWARFLQEKLEIKADGIFGKDTDDAVKDFQKKNNLTIDGIVGTGTWEALLKDDCSKLKAENKILEKQIQTEQLKSRQLMDKNIQLENSYKAEIAGLKAQHTKEIKRLSDLSESLKAESIKIKGAIRYLITL